MNAIITRIMGNPTAKTVRECELEEQLDALADGHLRLASRQTWLEELLIRTLPVLQREELGTRTNNQLRQLIADIKAEVA